MEKRRSSVALLLQPLGGADVAPTASDNNTAAAAAPSSQRRSSVAYSAETTSNKELADAFSSAPIQAYEAAEAALREAYEHRVASHGARDQQALATLHTLAELVKMENMREGAELLEECQRGCVAASPAFHLPPCRTPR